MLGVGSPEDGVRDGRNRDTHVKQRPRELLVPAPGSAPALVLDVHDDEQAPAVGAAHPWLRALLARLVAVPQQQTRACVLRELWARRKREAAHSRPRARARRTARARSREVVSSKIYLLCELS